MPTEAKELKMSGGKSGGESRRPWCGTTREPDWAERAALRFISEQVAVPLDQLAEYLGVYVSDARRVAEDFEALGWTRNKRFVVGDQAWVWLRQGGAAASGTGFGAKPPGVKGLTHRRAINEVRLMLERRAPEGRWVCERQLHRERIRRKRRDRAAHIPDGVLEIDGERHAIEVELTRKSREEMRSILESHSARYDLIVYFCTPQTKRHLERMEWAMDNPKLVLRDVEVEGRRLHAKRWRVAGEQRSLRPNEVEPWETTVLDLLGEQGTVPMDQLARFLRCSSEATDRLVKHLCDRGLIKRAKPLVDEPDWLWLTYSGVRCSTKKLGITHPGLGGLEEWRAANEARLYMAGRAPVARWISRRELWRGVMSVKSVPCAVLEVKGERHAVEVFLRSRREDRLVALWAKRSEEYDAVICFAGTSTCRALRRILKKGVWPKVVVRCIPEIAPSVASRSKPEELWELEEVPVAELPEGALEAIAKAAGRPVPPRVLQVGKRLGKAPRCFEVETSRGRFRVSNTRWNWRARKVTIRSEMRPPAPPKERRKAGRGSREGKPARRRPRVFCEGSVGDVCAEALAAIAQAAGLSEVPQVSSVALSMGSGRSQRRVVTDAGVWVVVKTKDAQWRAEPVSREELEENPTRSRERYMSEQSLTPREAEVAALVAKGLGNPAVAAELGVSVKTVENRLTGAYAKLGVSGAGARGRLAEALRRKVSHG